MDASETGQNVAPLQFVDFVIDPSRRSIQRGADTIALTPKTWAVLYYLASRPEQVVTKDELFTAAWPDTVVSDGTLSWCIKEIRRALGDKGRQPRYLKTVYGQGYQFIAPRPQSVDGTPPPSESSPSGFVGRVAELAQLQQLWTHVRSGRRQVTFITGEAGIGKTALVNVFIGSLTAEPVLVGWGQCVEQYGAGEAYHAMLDALNQIAHGPKREALLEALRTQAPSWLFHLPALLSAAERETLAAQYQGITQTQALRELADALEALAAHQPVVLVLEDLHWSDTATLAFLSALARRPSAARLLVLGTYRPVDLIVTDHPLRELKAELQLHGLCEEIALEYLSEAEVQTYATQRLGADSEQFAAELYARSGGNPLFLVNLVDYLKRYTDAETPTDLRARWEAMESIVPNRVQELILVQVERLALPERAVVEAASVNGATFFPALVAAGLGQEQDAVETICEDLEQRGRFIHALDDVTWPEGSVETPYAFQHALYREALYQKIAGGRRRRLHRAIGARLEGGYGKQAKKVAAELALHFEQGCETKKAVEYYAQAGVNALQRSAHQEAVFHATKGLALVETLPPSPTRLAHELKLQTLCAQGFMATKSHTAPEVEHALLRARKLSEQAGDRPRALILLLGLFHLYHGRSAMEPAKACAEEYLALAAQQQQPAFLLGTHYMMGVNALYQGELASAQTHLDLVGAGYDSAQHQLLAQMYGFNPTIICRLFGAIALGVRGYPDQAARQIEDTLSLELAMTHPFTNVYAHCVAPLGSHCLRDTRALVMQVEAGIALGIQRGFSVWIAFGTVLRGWGQVAQGAVEAGIAEMRAGVASMRELGARSQWVHYMTMLAEAMGQTGDYTQALQHIAAALADVDRGGERFYEPEAWRVKGELILQSKGERQKPTAQKEAETCFHKALEIARQQDAKLFELRTAVSLSRLWRLQGKKPEARALLTPLYEWFTEGFDTPDLHETKALLALL